MALSTQLRRLGSHFDRAVAFTLLNRFANLACSLLVISLVVTFFSSEIQGYYFTFNSLLLGQVLLELRIWNRARPVHQSRVGLVGL